MKIAAAVGFVLCAITFLGVAADECGGGIADYENFPPQNADFLVPSFSTGYQVIIPEFRFNCFGKILQWSALTVFNLTQNYSPTRVAFFQIWRPIGTSGRYTRVGYDKISVMPSSLPFGEQNPSPGEGLAFYNITSAVEDRNEDITEGEDNRPLYFQPGDIVGFYVRSGPLSVPLTVTYRDALPTDPDRLIVDMFYVTTHNFDTASDEQLCEISQCGENVKQISSVIPHLFFTYEAATEEEIPQPSNDNCYNSSLTLEDCPPPPPPPLSSPIPSTTPSPPTVSPTTSDSSTEGVSIPLVIAASSAGAVVIIGASLVCVAIGCLILRRKKFSKNTHYQATNCTYEAANEVLYSDPIGQRPRNNTYGPQSLAYASTYQTKTGERHMYQELEDRSQLPHFEINLGHESLHSLLPTHSRPPLPLQFTSGILPSGSSQRPPHTQACESSPQLNLPPLPLPPNIPPNIPMGAATDPHRRGSVPAHLRQPQRAPHPYITATGKSFPALPRQPSTSTPPTSPGSNLVKSPVAYSTPIVPRPWYQTDGESVQHEEEGEGDGEGEREREGEGEGEKSEGAGFLVPTMEERTSLSHEDLYSTLKRTHIQSDEETFFEETDSFWEPARSTAGIYQQLASRNFREVHRDYIKIQERLGSGNFGTVHRGSWRCPRGDVDVAVKLLQSRATEEDRVKFLQEAAIMGQFLHPNVVKLHGVVTLGEPLMIVIELMHKGDLKKYLIKHSRRISRSGSSSSRSVFALPSDFPNQLLSFCRQIASGMAYLSSKGFVHRDLATRNIFLTRDLICKIGDFGLARDLGNESIYHSSGGMIPIKWTAPEALNYRQFSSGSDVWSYGMVLFEIWSLGHRPFHELTEKDAMSLIDNCHCQPPPPGCPLEIYRLMTLCWNPDPQDRPSFSSIFNYLRADDMTLLSLPSPSPSLSPLATQLGAPLSEAKGLYLDLQYCYDQSVV